MAETVGLITINTAGYMANVASYQHGVGHGAWTRVDGFSEAIAWIAASEEIMH